MSKEPLNSLDQLLDRIAEAVEDTERVTLGRILETVGRRSFGPMLLFAGLITLSPIGAIPSIPSLMALLVLIVAVQLMFRRRYFWLPGWMLRRTIARNKLQTMLNWSRKPARWIDRVLKARLTYFTNEAGAWFMALICVVVAFSMPPMEFIPWSVTIAGVVLTLFGLALIAHDGLVALLGLLFAAGAYGLLVYNLL